MCPKGLCSSQYGNTDGSPARTGLQGPGQQSGPLDSASLSDLLRGAAPSSKRVARNSSQPMTDGDRSWADWLVAKPGRGQHRPQDPELRCFLGSQCRQDKVFFCQRRTNGANVYFLHH